MTVPRDTLCSDRYCRGQRNIHYVAIQRNCVYFRIERRYERKCQFITNTNTYCRRNERTDMSL